MRTLVKRSLPALLGLAVLAGPAGAQTSPFRVAPTPAYTSPADYGTAWGATYGPGAGFRTAPGFVPYWPAGYYNIYPDPYGGGLTGAANAINAQGEFEIQFQQARLLNQEVERSKIETRHRQWEEWLYEREHRPNVEDERERQRLVNIRRARNDPPFAEIWSGQALNDLLLAAQQQQAKRGAGPNVPLEDDVLPHINVTSGATPGGSGMLKDGGKLHWPLVLKGSAFDDDRRRLDELLPQAVRQAQSGEVDADLLDEMNRRIGRLRATVKANLDTITPSDDIRAKRYLNDLTGAVKALQDPDAAKYLSGKWAARGKTVAEMVAEMGRQGLKFAPAAGGDEAAYNALHRALVAYYAGPDPYAPWDPLAK
jgi:hypothetical protein